MSNVRQKRGGAKLSRSEVVTIRLDPKLRYLAELASRKQRRTLSSFIEWAIEESLKRESVCHSNNYDNVTFFDAAENLWDVNEVDRLISLAAKYPHLLNHEEQVLWKLIHEFSVYNSALKKRIWFSDNSSNNLNIELIRDCWRELIGIVDGTVSEEELKKAMIDNDIPF